MSYDPLNALVSRLKFVEKERNGDLGYLLSVSGLVNHHELKLNIGNGCRKRDRMMRHGKAESDGRFTSKVGFPDFNTGAALNVVFHDTYPR